MDTMMNEWKTQRNNGWFKDGWINDGNERCSGESMSEIDRKSIGKCKDSGPKEKIYDQKKGICKKRIRDSRKGRSMNDRKCQSDEEKGDRMKPARLATDNIFAKEFLS